eukprot:CAMPEP_0198519832 /NCGR_PEP_ID=MMETSP1462-20131121/19956_1 /TAXON_ID=1333877 /ORGANISM="Brandtodinium nutriculum, Strain RCC3387" /LENGTH=154 /DNA_ID=CAMNT_0044249451 /DNA_START=9 /DNA_END=474 /DNA_ORIENTATION=-
MGTRGGVASGRSAEAEVVVRALRVVQDCPALEAELPAMAAQLRAPQKTDVQQLSVAAQSRAEQMPGNFSARPRQVLGGVAGANPRSAAAGRGDAAAIVNLQPGMLSPSASNMTSSAACLLKKVRPMNPPEHENIWTCGSVSAASLLRAQPLTSW